MIPGLRRVLVLGGSGQLGSAACDLLSREGAEVVAPSRSELDLADADAVERYLAGSGAGLVINAAAFTDVTGAERPENRQIAFAVNRDLPAALASATRRSGIRLVHVSTDYVFDGESGVPYTEEDPVRPIQTYGLSKLEGEREVLARDPSAVVARTSTVFGPALRSRPNYVDAILRQARSASRVEVVELPIASPTFAPDLAAGLLRLAEVGAHGLVHVVNAGHCSRLELARAAVEEAGLPGVEVRACPAIADGVARPAYTALDAARFAALAGAPLRSWRDALADHVRRVRR
jgi:dTDP-4-dehydrorhamnose reductase